MSKFGPKSFEYCECERTQELAATEESPIKYNPETKEFTLEFDGIEGTIKYFIVFCPFCGGRLPARAITPPYETVTDEELSKLRSIINGCSSIADVIEKNGEPESTYCSITYTTLSEKAWVQIIKKSDKPLAVHVSKKRKRK